MYYAEQMDDGSWRVRRAADTRVGPLRCEAFSYPTKAAAEKAMAKEHLKKMYSTPDPPDPR